MKDLFYRSFFLGLIVLLGACGPTEVEESLELAGENRAELQLVLDLYSEDPADSLKLKAAEFLIAHMKHHVSTQGTVLQKYRERIVKSDTLVDYHEFNPWWKALKQEYGDSLQVVGDVEQVDSKYLIRNIERAFEAWERVPWRKEVDFDLFCHYILPYRLLDEPLADGWREYLYNKYHPLVADEPDVRKVYARLYDLIWKRSANTPECSYNLDPQALDNLNCLKCHQCCVLLGDICRSLGIPVAVDVISSWANYSLHGHAWVSLVLKDGTYTIDKNDTIATKHHGVYGTRITSKYVPEKDYPYTYEFTKKLSKVWRRTFEANPHRKQHDSFLLYSFPLVYEDVSVDYGLTDSVSLQTDFPVDYLFVGNFRTGDDWTPIAYEPLEKGACTFRGLADSVMYVPMVRYKERWEVLENPFMLVNGKKRTFTPDMDEKRSLALHRKYPLVAVWMDQWADMLGTYFEASNDPDFRTAVRIHTIDRTPVFPNRVKLEGLPKYRYVRYVCDLETTRMNHLEFYNHGKELKGHVIGCDTTDAKMKELSYVSRYEKGNIARVYTRGIDFGKPVELTEILYLPKNDGNFITEGHTYELLYYDLGWHSLGSRQARSYDALVFDNVPAHAVLLLKDLGEGVEERIFTYDDGALQWW